MCSLYILLWTTQCVFTELYLDADSARTGRRWRRRRAAVVSAASLSCFTGLCIQAVVFLCYIRRLRKVNVMSQHSVTFPAPLFRGTCVGENASHAHVYYFTYG